jgi:hypothetical protein
MRQSIKIAIIVITSILCLSVLFSIPYISLKIAFNDERMLQILNIYIKSTINKSSVISRAHIDLFPTPSFIVDNFNSDPERDGAMSAGEIVIKPSLSDLLIFRLKIKEIVMRKAQIKTSYDESGNMAIVGISRKEKSLPLPEKVKIKLENSKFEIDGVIKGDIIFENLYGDLELRKRGTNYLLESSIRWGYLSYLPSGSVETPIIPSKGSLTINAVYNKKDRTIEFSKSTFIIGGSSIDIDGRGSKTENGWKLSIRNKIEDGSIGDFMNILSPRRFGILSRVGCNGKINALLNTDLLLSREGGISNLHINGNMSLTDGTINALSVSGHKGNINRISFKAEISDRGIVINDIKGMSDGKGLSGYGEVIFGEEPTYSLSVDGHIDLGTICALMKAPGEWQCEGTGDVRALIEGDVSGDVLPSVDGRLDNITGSFALSPISQRIKVTSGSLLLKGREAELIYVSGMLGSANIKASGKLRGFIEPVIEFTLDMESSDLDQLMRKGLSGTKPKGDYNFTLKGSINIGRFKAKGFTAEDLSMIVLFSKNTIRISDMHMRAYNGTIDGTVEIAVPDGAYSVTLSGKGVDIGTYLASTTEYKDVITGGTTDFYINFNGKGTTKGEVKQTITGSGNILSRGFRAGNLTVLDRFSDWSGLAFTGDVNIYKLNGSFSLNGSRLKIKNCEITGQGLDMVRLFGTIGFNSDLEVICQMRLTREYTDKYRGRVIALFPDGEGRGSIAFICYGTTKKPMFRLDYDQMRKLAEGSIPQLTDEILEKYKIY